MLSSHLFPLAKLINNQKKRNKNLQGMKINKNLIKNIN